MAKKVYTVEGISVKLDPRIFSDYEVNDIMVAMQQPLPEKDDPKYEKAASEAGILGTKLVNLILGDAKSDVLAQLREKGDGYVSIEDMYGFIVKLVQENATIKK